MHVKLQNLSSHTFICNFDVYTCISKHMQDTSVAGHGLAGHKHTLCLLHYTYHDQYRGSEMYL